MLACTALQHLVPRPGIDDAADRPSVVCTLCWAVSVRQIRMNTWHLQKAEGRFLHINDAIEGVFVSLWCTIFFREPELSRLFALYSGGQAPCGAICCANTRHPQFAISNTHRLSHKVLRLAHLICSLGSSFVPFAGWHSFRPPPMRGYAPQCPNLALFRDLLVIYIGI